MTEDSSGICEGQLIQGFFFFFLNSVIRKGNGFSE